LAGGFEILEHTADMGIQVWGETWEEVFQWAAEGMVSLIVDLSTVIKREKRTLHLQRDTGEELLLTWLKEILFLMEKGGMVFSEFQIGKDNFSHKNSDNYWLYGFLRGEKRDPSRHEICTEIKAVTRHGFFLDKKGPLWKARILFDV